MLVVDQGGRSKQARNRWATGAPPPSPFIAEGGQPAPPAITCNDGFSLHVAGTCQVGQLPRQRGEAETPTSNKSHASTKAAGCWGLRRSALALWLRLEAKFERTLGLGATVGVLGTRVLRLACLRPTAWLCWQACTAHLHQQGIQTLVRGQASRGRRHETSSGAASPGCLVRGG